VLRRLRHPATVLIASLLVVPALTACGSSSEKDAEPTDDGGLSAVTFTGDVGTSLDSKWHTKIAAPEETKVHTLVEGKGEKIADGDTVSAYLYIGNGTTKKDAYSDYDNGAPESIPNNSQVGAVFQQLFKDATYGSRVAAVTTATELLGSSSGNPQLGIGANDNLVIVADLVKKAEVSPTPSDDKAHDAPASSLPKVVLKQGKPAALDWQGVAKPSLTTPVQRVVLKKGTGATVKASDTVTVNYLGSTYQAKSPFESSFGKTPLTQPLSGLVEGWKIGLSGVKVGSRVLLQMPPAYGYGAEGSGADIPGNATLWFVIDVVKAK